VAAFGAAGALTRYGLDRFIEHRLLAVFPWSTFAINMTGSFVAGVAVAQLVDRHDAPAWVRTGVVVGFLGAYTTRRSRRRRTTCSPKDTARLRSRTPRGASRSASPSSWPG
jgi:fluoride exporter